MTPSSSVVIKPATHLEGTVRLPGDKSISHRYAMLGAIAEGTSHLTNFSTGADCTSTLSCLKGLGVECERTETEVVIHGLGPQLSAPYSALDCGNSGSTMRMLSGILAGQEFSSELTGDESLSGRPMARIIKPLQMMGAKVDSREGKPPLRIVGGHLRAIQYTMPVASAQVKSSLLFAGLYADGITSVEESVRTRDHGEIALRAFGAEVRRDRNKVSIAGWQKLKAIEANVPGDTSSAAFFLCGAALFPGSHLTMSDLLMNPTRSRLLDLLIAMGVKISVLSLEDQHGEPRGTIQAEGNELRGATIAGPETAALIDEIPVLAAIAPYTKNGVQIRDAAELRVKESDRIAAVAANLRAMGAEVEEREDGLRIPGEQKLHGAQINSHGDHRIAMAFAIAALRAEGETTIEEAEAAAVSYPEFFQTLHSLTN